MYPKHLDALIHIIFVLSFAYLITQESFLINLKTITLQRFIVSILFPLVVTYRAHDHKSLTLDGCLVAFFIGFIITSVNRILSCCTVLFLYLGNKATRHALQQQNQTTVSHLISRNSTQVLANGGLVALCCLVQLYLGASEEQVIHQNPTTNHKQFFIQPINLMALMSLAAACGDTWSSEFGFLSRSYPRLICFPWKKVPRGTNGGVTFWGLMMAICGGFCIGLGYITFSFIFISFSKVFFEKHFPLELVESYLLVLFFTTVSGLLGTLVDSFLGSLFQYSALHKETQCITETPGPHVIHISGLNLLTNNCVNLLSCVLTSLIMLYGVHLYFPLHV